MKQLAARRLRVIAVALLLPVANQAATPLATALVAASSDALVSSHDGVVEAVRQSVMAAQISAVVVAVPVKAGDRVKAGQVLIRLDARAASQHADAAAAQGQAARVAQEAAVKDLERQQQLFRQNYISQAALDRAASEFQVAQAQANAQLAEARAAQTTSGFYVVKAPYAAIVSDVAVVLGDMALPGKALVTLHDPSALRVTAAVPEGMVSGRAGATSAAPRAELPGLQPGLIQPVRWQVLPSVDATTHTVEVRLDLPPSVAAAPGMFARVWLPGTGAQGVQRLSIPAKAVVRRAELVAVYVIDAQGRPLLRQVRLGPASGDRVEVLAGLNAGERIALDPQAAAAIR